MSSRARLEITVHTGQTIQVSAIFVFTYRVKTSIFFYIVDVACSIYLHLVLRRSVLMKGQYIFKIRHILVTFISHENVEISI